MSVIKTKGIVDDIPVLMDSWEYSSDFLVLNLKYKLEGHPVMLGRHWLATINAYIKCQTRNMMIAWGTTIKTHIVYPSTKPII